MVDEKNTQKESIKVLQECAELQIKKSQDYNNPDSRVRQEMYYTRGVATLLDIMWGKMLRMYSVVEAMENDIEYNPNFESLEDSAKDMIMYSSFVFWIVTAPGPDTAEALPILFLLTVLIFLIFLGSI